MPSPITLYVTTELARPSGLSEGLQNPGTNSHAARQNATVL